VLNKQKTSRERALSALAEPSRLMRKLLLVLGMRKVSNALAPPGKRSGEGSESLTAYLNEARNSKPGDLE
jgi:hypothetical protein